MAENVCCKVGCEAKAEWDMWHGVMPDDNTHSCTKHVGDMLTDAEETRVYPLAP